MSGIIATRLIGDFLFGFGALFAIINPYGLAFIFLDRTISLSEGERARIALRIAIYAFSVLLVSIFIGSQILNFFGISIPALRIAGGLVVAVSGWSMLHEPPPAHDVHATSTANFEAVQRMAFFPLTIPLTTGPGTIATAIAIGSNRPDDLDAVFTSTVASFLVAVAVTGTIYHAFKRSSAMARLFGEEGTSIVTRLSAFLLLCIGVQIIVTGVVDIAKTILENAPRP
jgi:multiple antibiotic resistance protein